MKEITIIEPTINDTTNNLNQIKNKSRNVCGYARVSTDKDEQFSSFEAQIQYYSNLIQSNDNWNFVGVYSDEGKTGTSTKKRNGFKRMIEDAKAGQIDLIITKSLSRFARNTVDSLLTIRTLKEYGCECYFEKENIYTFDAKGELLITIMSSVAQEESRSISDNVTWGIKRQMAKGITHVPYKNFLGYDRGPDGNLIINKEQAQIVKSIYYRFLAGKGINDIRKELEEEKVPSPSGKGKWYVSTIRSILSNEKYIGDARLQKTYTSDYLTKKKIKNNGERTQYYINSHHEAIIEKSDFELAQVRLQNGDPNSTIWWMNMDYEMNIYAKIKCPYCGHSYTKKYINNTKDKYYFVCVGSLKSKNKCKKSCYIYPEDIDNAYSKIINDVSNNESNIYIESARKMIDSIDTKYQIKELNCSYNESRKELIEKEIHNSNFIFNALKLIVNGDIDYTYIPLFIQKIDVYSKNDIVIFWK